ncbi:energy transducer TonB [Bacteroidales bacterium]|nr:energy transducer TonB [Bacteroidales bacterium]
MKFKKKLTYQDFKRYFGNFMSKREQHAFESNIFSDVFDEDAFDGLSTLSDKEFEEDVKELNHLINERIEPKKLIPVWIRTAAIVLMFLGAGTFSVFHFDLFSNKSVSNNAIADHTPAEQHQKLANEVAITPQEVVAEKTNIEPSKAEGQKVLNTVAPKTESNDLQVTNELKTAELAVVGSGGEARVLADEAGESNEVTDNAAVPTLSQTTTPDQGVMSMAMRAEEPVGQEKSAKAISPASEPNNDIAKKAFQSESDVEDSKAIPPSKTLKAYKDQIVGQLMDSDLVDEKGTHKIKLSLIVNELGEPTNLSFNKSPGKEFEAEVRKAINNLPLWSPATKNGQTVSETVELTIKFSVK